MKYVWVRIGDSGEYESFDAIAGAIDYVNELKAGQVTGWVLDGRGVGCETVNYWGCDFISLFWGDENGGLVSELDADERAVVENELEVAYI